MLLFLSRSFNQRCPPRSVKMTEWRSNLSLFLLDICGFIMSAVISSLPSNFNTQQIGCPSYLPNETHFSFWKKREKRTILGGPMPLKGKPGLYESAYGGNTYLILIYEHKIEGKEKWTRVWLTCSFKHVLRKKEAFVMVFFALHVWYSPWETYAGSRNFLLQSFFSTQIWNFSCRHWKVKDQKNNEKGNICGLKE